MVYWFTGLKYSLLILIQVQISEKKSCCVALREKSTYSEFFWSYFPAAGLNTERYGVIQSECVEVRIRKTQNMDNFHAVQDLSYTYSCFCYYKYEHTSQDNHQIKVVPRIFEVILKR